VARRRIIEGRWRCASCDSRDILGRHKVCPQCGSPREAGELAFDFGASAQNGGSDSRSVDDPELLALARAGADWVCAACDAGNRGDLPRCERCGAERGGTERAMSQGLAAVRRSGFEFGALTAWFRRLGVGASALVASLVATCSGMCGIYAWTQRDIEVEATVAQRTWIRIAHLERLTPSDVEGWRDRLPAPAGTPGRSSTLAEGLGELYGCETRKCWPRPPDGGTTGRVLGVSWERNIRTRVMGRSAQSGWDEQVPSSSGAMPSGGIGGHEGQVDLVCSRKEREPERCREVSRQEACGTDERCRVVDQGNGFAEEICEDVTRYCTVSEQKCDPAVYDEWCTWTELRWQGGRAVHASGRDTKPSWPSFQAAADEEVSRDERYLLHLQPLAGAPHAAVALAGPEQLDDHAPGALVYALHDVRPVPTALIPTDVDRVDCGDGVPFDALGTRDWCRYEQWTWRPDGPREARDHDGPPDWPEQDLGQDGRSRREERVEVELVWKRGGTSGSRVLTHPADAWQDWPVGREVPVIVDAEARFVEFPTAR
jgi:hypothetical protein